MKKDKRMIILVCILCFLFLTSCGMFSSSKARAMALAYVTENYEDISDDLRIVEERSDEYSRMFRFQLYYDGYPVQNTFMDIFVDPKNGDIYDETYGKDFDISNMPTIEASLDKDEAVRIFNEDLKNNLYYFTNLTKTSTPMYLLGMIKSVDAETGEMISLSQISFEPIFDHRYVYGDVGSIIEDKKLLNKMTMSTVFAEMRGEDDKSTYIDEFELYTSRWIGYLWKIDLPNERYIFDAQTGEMLSFVDFREQESLDGSYVEETQALEAAFCYLKELGIELSDIQLTNIKTPNENAADPFVLRRDLPERYTFEFLRIHNGIGCLENGISVTVGEKNGKILGYTRVWKEDMEFMEGDQFISAEEAFDVYNSFGEFTLGYGLTLDREYRPAYFFLRDIEFAVNAVTGERIYAEE